MQLTTVLLLIVALVVHVHGAGLPNTTDGSALPNGTQKPPGNRRFQANFQRTDNLQTLCSQDEIGDSQGHYARLADRKALKDVMEVNGFWEMSDWDGTAEENLRSVGTCSFRVSRWDFKNTRVTMGNWDIAQVMGDAIGASHAGLVGSKSRMTCIDTEGPVAIFWSLIQP